MVKILRNIFGMAVCTLFIVLSSPVKADLLSENIEALTNDEDWWDHGDCVRASGFCFMGGVEYAGVSLIPD